MALAESRRDDGIEAVAIMLPNHLHAAASRIFLAHGIDVICEKPLARTLAEALELEAFHAKHPGVFVLAHNYSGFPMVREARVRIAAGTLGELRVVHVEHAVSSGVEPPPNSVARPIGWRADPNIVGPSAVLADVGVHARHFIRYNTGLEVSAVAADLMTLAPGRSSDDNAHVMLRLGQAVRGTMWASFMPTGNRQGLKIRVYGTQAALAWDQEDPDRLIIRPQHEPHYVLRRGEPWTSAAALAATRRKAGQVEGQSGRCAPHPLRPLDGGSSGRHDSPTTNVLRYDRTAARSTSNHHKGLRSHAASYRQHRIPDLHHRLRRLRLWTPAPPGNDRRQPAQHGHFPAGADFLGARRKNLQSR